MRVPAEVIALLSEFNHLSQNHWRPNTDYWQLSEKNLLETVKHYTKLVFRVSFFSRQHSSLMLQTPCGGLWPATVLPRYIFRL